MIYYSQKITTLKQSINFLKWCRVIHWRYSKHPQWCRGNLGSQDHHQYAVRKYTEIIKKEVDVAELGKIKKTDIDFNKETNVNLQSVIKVLLENNLLES